MPRSFLHLLWRMPLYSLLPTLLFGTLNGGTRDAYLGSFLISLTFTYTIGIAMWVLENLVLPRFPSLSREENPGRLWQTILAYAAVCLSAGYLAAYLIHRTLVPGFLGTARDALLIGVILLTFGALFTGILLATIFYRKALDRAKAEQELQLARRIQRSFLLSEFPASSRLEVHALNVSSNQVSGDFYDAVPAGDGAFLVAIADVAGKGVPAALLSSMLQASLRTQALSVPSVSVILRNINTLVYRSTAVHQFATFFLARVDEQTLRLSYSNAGHNFPVVFRRGGERVTLERGGTVVGIMESATFEEEAIQLEPGDRVVLYTDGINEAANPRGELFGEERLYRVMDELPADLGAREVIERIFESLRAFLDGQEPGDDMTLLVMRVLESAGADRDARNPANRAGHDAVTHAGPTAG